MLIISLQIGKGVTREYQNKPIQTACFKYPVDGERYLSFEGFIGDEQADQVNHGGPDKAVLVYSAERYSHWSKFLGQEPGASAFGENLTVTEGREEDVCIGDIYKVGTAIVQVSQPRIPCFKMNVRHGNDSVLNEMLQSGFTGYYFRVLEEGKIKAGDVMQLVHRTDHAPSIAFANHIRHHDSSNRLGLERLFAATELAEIWKPWLTKRLEQWNE